MATVFVSPGVYTAEQDFSAYASQIGITKLGLVGVTLKGPAFQAISITNAVQFLAEFGATTLDSELPYDASAYLSQSSQLTVTRVLGIEGFTNSPAWIIKASGGTHTGAVMAVIRSKSGNEGISFLANNPSDVTISQVTGPLNSFVLSATTGPLTAYTNGLTVSLDETASNYIVNVLGTNPEQVNNDYGFYVESIYPHFIREAVKRNEISNIYSAITYSNEEEYTNYQSSYTNPVTPWIVSRTIGGEVRNLFRFQSISAGNSANQEIKISIVNIDTINLVFDVIIRDYNDTDATVGTAFERYSKVSLDPSLPNFIGNVIGTTDEQYAILSSYVSLDFADNYPINTVPAGFTGYPIRLTGISGTTLPKLYYKTSYLSGDSVNKTFLGISELAYTANTAGNVTYNKVISTLESDLFNYQGADADDLVYTPGFHLESAANNALFDTGVMGSIDDYTLAQAKFTLVPAGGFDGFNQYRDPSFTTSSLDVNNVIAMKSAIDTMGNPEEIDINLFALPGLNYQDNVDVVKYALDMIETRADSIYIIDAPRLSDNISKGNPVDVVSALQDTGINSSYAASYWPWIQINDSNLNKNVYISPTSEVIRSIAYTDNVAYPWFAPAGFNRGTLNSIVLKADIRLASSDRDTLYAGRINPIATFAQQGIVIFGQKTLQIKQTALDRINVRRLLLQIRRLVAAASQTLLFEQNDQTLIDQFIARVTPILLQIQNQRGLTAFQVIMDDTLNTPQTIDNNQLVGRILLKPTKTAEFIDLAFTVLPTGAQFSSF